MSKVRPKRAPRLSPDFIQPVVLKPKAPSDDHPSKGSSCTTTSSSSLGTFPSSVSDASITSESSSEDHSQFSTIANMFTHFPYNSDSGFGIMNPMYNERNETPDLPSPIKPCVSTSLSMPTLSSSASGLVPSPAVTTSANGSGGSVTSTQASPTRPSIITPPNTPSSSALTGSGTPWPSKSESAKEGQPSSNSVELTTPPNTPFSNPSSPKEESDFYRPLNIVDQSNDVYNPAMAARGPLYNILGYPVDLPNTKPCVVGSNQISPKDTHSKLYPFSSYPNPRILDNFTDNEKVLKHLAKLANGKYNGGPEKKNFGYQNPLDSPEILSKDDSDWVNLDEKDQCVAACWNHNVDRPNRMEINNNESNRRDDPTDFPVKMRKKPEAKSAANQNPNVRKDKEEKKQPNKESYKPAKFVNEDPENKRNSLFEDLDVPMIDADDGDNDVKRPESPTALVTDCYSDSLDDDILEDEADELTERLGDITSEAGKLLTKELKDGLDYLTEPEDTLRFSWTDVVTVIISIILFYFDLVSDCNVVYNMYYDRDTKGWFIVSMIFLILPLILSNAFSLYWYWFDERVCEPGGVCYRHPQVPKYVWALRVLCHLFLHASILRQIDILYYGQKSKPETACRAAVVDEVMKDALEDRPEDILEPRPEDVLEPRPKNVFEPRPEDVLEPSPKSVLEPRPEDEITPEEDRRRRVLSQKGLQRCARRTRGTCSKGGYVALWIHAERDAANVDMFLSLVQDAPQLILHFYIMAQTLPGQVEEGQYSQTLMWQVLKESSSFLTLAWSVTSFIRAIRLVEPSMCNLSLMDLLWVTLAHMFSIAGQVMSFSLFASKLLAAFCVIASFHWLTMSIWILIQLLCFPRTTCTRAVYAHDQMQGPCSKLDDIFYSAVMGIIFLFTFVDVGGISPKTQLLLYHTFRLLEEAILLTAWFVWVNGEFWYHWLPLILVPVFFILNLLFDSLFCAYTKPVTCIALPTAANSV